MELQELRQHINVNLFSVLPQALELAIKKIESGEERMSCLAISSSVFALVPGESQPTLQEMLHILEVYKASTLSKHLGKLPQWWNSWDVPTAHVKQERLNALSYFLGAVKVHVRCQLARERALAG